MVLARTSRFTRLAGKELKETLRDRRTLMTLFLMPILLYPLLSLIMNRLLLSSGVGQSTEFRVGVLAQADADVLLDVIQSGKIAAQSDLTQPLKILWSKTTDSNLSTSTSKSTTKDSSEKSIKKSDSNTSDANTILKQDEYQPNQLSDVGFRLLLVEDGDLENALANGQIDIALRSKTVAASDKVDYTPILFEIGFREGDLASENATIELRKIFALVNEAAAVRHRIVLGIPDAVPIRMVAVPSQKSSNTGSSFAGIIPLILILMTITGGVYPAIDLTAGERERGTLEALIASPISRFQLVASKYVAVVCVAILTAFINLFAMSLTLKVTGVGDLILGRNGMDGWMLAQTIPLLIIFAIFFSSILVALCSFARSFKEAQAYLIPIMLLSLGPGIISLMPSVKLTASLAVLPQVNLILLARDTLGRIETPIYIVVITILTTLFYTLAALAVASKGFGDQVAIAGDDFRWSDLLRRPEQRVDFPTLSQLAIYLSVFFPIYFISTSILGSTASIPLQARSWINAASLFVLFVMLPLAYSTFVRLRIKTTYRLRLGSQPLITCIVAILLAATLWMFAFEILRCSDWLGLKTLSDEVLEKTKELREQFLLLPWWLVMVTMALAPAVAEEFFFRGFVLSSFHTAMNKHRAVWLTALLFGVFHVVYGSLLSIERFLPTMMLGVFLGYLAVYSQSLLPGILLHAGHNGLLFSLPYMDQALKNYGFDREVGSIPWTWLVIGSMIVIASMVWLVASQTRRPPAIADNLSTITDDSNLFSQKTSESRPTDP